MAQPSNQDQLMLELINRARANPQAEADRLIPGGDLNEGVSSESTISTDPKQPLAWNEALIAAANVHTVDMFDQNAVNDNDYFAHIDPYDNTNTPSTRASAEGYSGAVGENLAVVVSTASFNLTDVTIENYENLFIDENYPNRGHRVNLMEPDFEEVGIENAIGTNYIAGGLLSPPSSADEWPYAAIATQDFGFVSGANPFLTGVVYDDTMTDDDFYTVGEGLGNIAVSAVSSAGTFETSTYNTGGYQLQLAPDTYQVTFSGDLNGDTIPDTLTQEVVIGSQNVKVDVECFLTGTRILTEHAEVAVENLKIGDRIRTADGKLEPVKWIGRQTIQPDLVKSPLRGYPVLIKAGALGHNIPCRDLYVSPCHSLLVEGLLIDAGALVNELSIVYTQPSDAFVYYHVELEHHALLVAEGASAESYLPQKETREEYDNSDEYKALHPHGSNLMLWPMDYPRVSSKNKVPRFVSQKLMAIAAKDFSLSFSGVRPSYPVRDVSPLYIFDTKSLQRKRFGRCKM